MQPEPVPGAEGTRPDDAGCTGWTQGRIPAVERSCADEGEGPGGATDEKLAASDPHMRHLGPSFLEKVQRRHAHGMHGPVQVERPTATPFARATLDKSHLWGRTRGPALGRGDKQHVQAATSRRPGQGRG